MTRKRSLNENESQPCDPLQGNIEQTKMVKTDLWKKAQGGCVLMLFLLMCLAPGASAETKAPAGMAALPLKLPKPMFVGTPQNIKGVKQLEKPLGKPRPAFFAPKGVKNLALGKKISGSDEEPIMGELAMITDGDKEAADGSYVELGPFTQQITIDLEATHDIYAMVFWHYHKQARVYFDVVVQISDDPDFKKFTTVYNNDHDNSAEQGVGKDNHYVETSEGRLVDTKGVRGRYVRLYSGGNNASDLNHYIEVEVFGK
ncbi:MAG: hypothetical protein CMO43_10475 [Verrucomicrobiales bacterium]|nr:hypothetical protein [Verrucomicrobiales bacterium]MDP7013407.1 hypothetical protein [Verrucomicrobiota bacterium]